MSIAYKNLNKLRKKINVVIKFYFNLLSVQVEAFFASLAVSYNKCPQYYVSLLLYKSLVVYQKDCYPTKGWTEFLLQKQRWTCIKLAIQ